MSEIIEPKIEEQPGERLSWIKVWISVLTRPSIATFERILRDPQASPRRAYLWVGIAALIGAIMTGAISRIGLFGNQQGLGTSFLTNCAPANIVAALLSLAAVSWVAQRIAAGFFKGRGKYASMVYASGAFYAPIILISGLISGIPYVNCLSIPLLIYALVLGVMAVKAVNQIGWVQAAVSFLIGLVLVTGIVAVFTICVLTLLGPAVSESFQNTLQQLESGGVTP